MNKMKTLTKIRKIIKMRLKMMIFILTLMNLLKKKNNSMEVARKRVKLMQSDQLHLGSIMKNQNMKITKL